jgi:parallel beta-helix repeat protein
VSLSSAGISGTDAADFAVSSTSCGSTLVASASCTASIVFKPAAAGALSASWSITAGSTKLTITLSGTGTTSGGGTGTTFYVSNCGTVGSDSNRGTSPSSPWLTIAKVNSSTFTAGDSIDFNDGCIWREQLNLPSPGSAGKPITVGTYGSGLAPIISGSKVASNWIAEPQTAANFTNDANLQANWDMDQMSGSNFLDSTQNGNILTNTNGITQSTNHIQGSYSAAFTASSRMILSRSDAALSAGFVGKSGTTNTNITVGGWVYFNSTAPSMSFMLKGPGKDWGLFLGVGSNTGKMEWQTYLNSGYRLVASNNVIAPGAWHHVVGRVNAATNEQALFIDGVKQNNTYTAPNTTMFTDTTPLEIGATNSSYYLDGYVDELFVFKRALSDSEIAGIYNSGLDGSRGPDTLYYATGFSEPTVVYENGVAMTYATQKTGMTQGSWWWDSTNSRVYIRPTKDVEPSTETIEIPVRATCIIDYRNYTTISGLTCQEPTQKGVYVTGADVNVQNMLIQHIRSNGPTTPNNSADGVGVFWEGSHDTIQNNTVTDANWGIFSYVTSGNTINSGLVQSNTVSDIAYDGIGLSVAYPNGGVLTNTVAQYNVVHDAGIYGMEGGALECIQAGSSIGTGNAIRYNVAYNNGMPSLHAYPLNVQGGSGKCSFYGNLVYNNYGPCFEVANGPGGNNFYNNVCYNNGLAGLEGAGVFLTGGSGNSGNTIENNIVYAPSNSGFMDVTSGTGSGNTFNYNLYYGGSSTPFTWNGTAYSLPNYEAASGQDSQSLNANPQFTNPSANNFTLTSTSPAIGAGINLGSDYQFDLKPGSVWPNNVSTASQNSNGAWDIGAYVYQ